MSASHDAVAERRVLVLAGTTEARRLIDALAERGWDVTASLAGRTSSPVHLACPVRVGGFGGVDGLADHLVAERIDVLVDATHPFACQMPRHARTAADRAGIPRLRLRRPPYPRHGDDGWTEVDSLSRAAAVLRPGRTALLTIGRQDLDAFRGLVDVHLVVRSIDPPDLPGATIVRERGPFTVAHELDLLRSHHIDVLVTKDSGGDDAKLRAARAGQIEVVMVRRPPDIDGPLAETVDQAVAWFDGLSVTC